MRKQLLIMALASLSIIGGCAVDQNGRVGPDGQVFNKETILPLGGGLLGAAVCNRLFKGHGSRKGWTAACGAAGYLVSTSFVRRSSEAFESNKTGQTSSWKDPDGKQYSVTPTKTYYQDERPCREFRQTVEINGQTEILTGDACRQNDGTWKVMG
ncbi:MAG: RT0821/Lpp0805 family surface protein [Arenicella sp.]